MSANLFLKETDPYGLMRGESDRNGRSEVLAASLSKAESTKCVVVKGWERIQGPRRLPNRDFRASQANGSAACMSCMKLRVLEDPEREPTFRLWPTFGIFGDHLNGNMKDFEDSTVIISIRNCVSSNPRKAVSLRSLNGFYVESVHI